jgi:hypothetical protein
MGDRFMRNGATRAEMMDAARTIRTIIEYEDGGSDGDIERLVDDNRRPDNPIEFLCLAVGGSSSRSPFPNLDEATKWVGIYRHHEALRVNDLTTAYQARLPICMLVALDPPPTQLQEWREDSELRENVANLGALLVDRPKPAAQSVTDDDLFLEIIVAAMLDPVPIQPTLPTGGFDFLWKPSHPVGPLGAEYGRQPSPIDSPNKDFKDFIKRFDAYPQDSPDLEF